MNFPKKKILLFGVIILIISTIIIARFHIFPQETFSINPPADWNVREEKDIFYLENLNKNIKLSIQYGESDWNVVKSGALYISKDAPPVYYIAQEATIAGQSSVKRIGRNSDGSYLFYNVIMKHPKRVDGFLNIEAGNAPPMSQEEFHRQVDNLLNYINFK